MLVVTPNLCFDSTIRMTVLSPGTVSRALGTELTAGGKGVNVIRALPAARRSDARLIGFVPDRGGARLVEFLHTEGIDITAVPNEGAVRVCTIVLEDEGRITVVNGPGPHVSAERWGQFRQHVASSMHGGEVVICDGSLPPGVPNDGYAQLVADARDAGCSILVDAAPGPLGAALQAHPDVVSPNLSEAEALLRGRSDEQVDERGPDIEQRALVAAEELRGRGARYAVVTAGAAGAALATPTGAWWLTAPKINVVSSIGAGDSFVAGVAGSLSAGLLDVETVRRGIAVASASCEQQLAGGVDYRRVEELMRGVVVRQVRQAECTEVRS